MSAKIKATDAHRFLGVRNGTSLGKQLQYLSRVSPDKQESCCFWATNKMALECHLVWVRHPVVQAIGEKTPHEHIGQEGQKGAYV